MLFKSIHCEGRGLYKHRVKTDSCIFLIGDIVWFVCFTNSEKQSELGKCLKQYISWEGGVFVLPIGLNVLLLQKCLVYRVILKKIY